ncbi:MAG: SDR family NAD(P)-dependent oxidoreductase [Gammaproteobacteria bacterium]|nr:SDR family NAD(P)-dependent oxidoreductase [Gammaproteobacteria bacterium]
MGNLTGKTAVVTGAGRGIGRETALLLAKEGASVVVVDPGGDRSGAGGDKEVAETVVKEITDAGGKAVANFNSVSDFDQAANIIEQCVSEFGKIDILVNVAGMLRERMVWNMTEDDWDAVITVHLKGHFNTCHHASKRMRENRHGRIINFASDAWKGSVGQCNYSAAKGGIISLTRSLARELGRFGVTANAICPLAATRMTMNDKVIEGMKRRYESGLITKEFLDKVLDMPGPEFIPPIIAYLATDAAKDVNSQIFHAERGMIHTYQEPVMYRALTKTEDGGMFTVDDLLEAVPTTLMAGVENIAPEEAPKE